MQPIRALVWAPHDDQTRTTRRTVGHLVAAAFAGAATDLVAARTLWNLFGRGDPVPRNDADDVLGAELVNRLLDCELLTSVDLTDQEWVRAQICVLTATVAGRNVLVASDFPWYDDDPEYVGGPGNAASTLVDAALAAPPDGSTALDVGTGSGAIATLLTQHYPRVIATDINPRALAFAELTAALNGCTLHVRLTSFTDGVDDLASLVLCNPPFVLGAEEPTTFRDAGPGLPEPHELAASLRRCLAPGGRAVMLANWPYRTGAGDAREAVAASLRGAVTDCDVLVVERAVVDPMRYAEVWSDDPDDALAWADRLRADEIATIGTGLIVIDAPTDTVDDEPGHRDVDVAAAHGTSDEPLGVAIAAWHDRLRVLGRADELLEVTVRSAPRQVYDTATGQAVAAVDALRLSVHGPAIQIGQVVLPILEGCAAPITVGEAIAKLPMSRVLGRFEVLGVIKALIRAGLLVPCEVTRDPGNKSGTETFH